jgi:biotin operon repressor
MGRLSARERVTHLLLELRERLDRAGLVKGDTFRIPLTQEVFADALGLSVVHINRTMKQLRQSGSVVFKSGSVTIRDPERLAAMAQYQSPLAPSEGLPPPALAARSAAAMRESADRRATA